MKKVKELIIKIGTYKIIRCIIIALTINFICDILTQRSIIEAFIRLFTKPLTFLYNMLLIMLTIAFCEIFKKRKFAISVCSIIWIGVAITNFVVQGFRNTPFSFVDLILLPSVFSVFNNYLKLYEMISLSLLIVGIIFIMILIYKKEANKDRMVKHSFITSMIVITLLFSIKSPFIKVGAISDDYNNLEVAYEEYGLPYCFVNSVLNLGVDKPDEYNEIVVDEVVQNIEIYNNSLKKENTNEYTINSEIKPNVIYLQLESFIDPNNLINLNYSQNPTQTFTYLKENYPSGVLTVPTLGAGTANVEFEIMTGFNLEHFGAGDYPYKTVVNKMPVESIAYLLKEEGYYTSVIHNNRASFYDREDVFPYLGYDKFVTAEYMINLDFTPNGWYKDNVLPYEIFKLLNSTEESDLIYTISVQPHGKYYEDLTGLDLLIDVTSNDSLTKEKINQYKYYVNQLYEVDMMLANLINEINNYNEPTMLVIFGDHLPSLEIEAHNTKYNNLYNSEYVIYTNYNIDVEDKDLYSYQLSSHILNILDCDNGIINKVHQTRNVNKNYQSDLKTIMYDIVEGEQYVYNKKQPYEKTNIIIGYDDIIIDDYIYDGETLIIKGNNLNIWSSIYINDKHYETEYIDQNTLKIHIGSIKNNSTICVKQQYNNLVYSSSNIIIYNINNIR